MANMYTDGRYLAESPGWHAGDAPFKAKHVCDLIDRNRLKVETLVDVGCGAGFVSREVARHLPSTEVTGFEISADAATLWPDNRPANLKYHHGDYLSEERHDDLVLLLDVFEHVPDYMGFLKALSHRADRFIFNVPLDLWMLSLLVDHQVEARRRYGHLHYFSRATALATLADTGYKVVDEQLAPAFDGLDPTVRKQSRALRALHPARRIGFRISPSVTAKTIGGVCMFVLCERAG
jgi:SAM-dependent methyltransferase